MRLQLLLKLDVLLDDCLDTGKTCLNGVVVHHSLQQYEFTLCVCFRYVLIV